MGGSIIVDSIILLVNYIKQIKHFGERNHMSKIQNMKELDTAKEILMIHCGSNM